MGLRVIDNRAVLADHRRRSKRTQPPATQPPVTEPPATEPPVTEPPVNSRLSQSHLCRRSACCDATRRAGRRAPTAPNAGRLSCDGQLASQCPLRCASPGTGTGGASTIRHAARAARTVEAACHGTRAVGRLPPLPVRVLVGRYERHAVFAQVSAARAQHAQQRVERLAVRLAHDDLYGIIGNRRALRDPAIEEGALRPPGPIGTTGARHATTVS